MFNLDLRTVSTFFCENSGHDTWINPENDEKFQLDHFLVPWIHFMLVKDVKKKNYGVPNGHCALLLKLDINKGKRSNSNTTTNIPKKTKEN
jgi:hypothetical protein